jgi:hypothetical protein
MKKILLVLFGIAVMQTATAQITLEHNYPNAFNWNGGGIANSDFGITWLTSATTKYYLIDYPNETITLYNMNHSVFSTITIPVTYTSTTVGYYVSYITANLFDCDSVTIEYLLSYYDYNGKSFYVRVYRDNGTQLININNSTLDVCIGCAGIVKHAIQNTPSGAKMLVGLSNNSESVYSLCGSLPSGFNELTSSSAGPQHLNAFPNPATDFTVIEYTLPQGERTGEIIFSDMHGNIVKKFIVDQAFHDLRISTDDLPSGTYLYSLHTRSGSSESRKIIKIN